MYQVDQTMHKLEFKIKDDFKIMNRNLEDYYNKIKEKNI